ncbi:hypothetical protein [Candidatus Sodalis pierantonius]|uniref:hypothetical protein n=1 Tax=Candidatus Sodalis pierantonii TaxID=1486991 RepID=UPI0011DDD141|nr:hypothetical protein [Candidatus Sodalis pierantonius]
MRNAVSESVGRPPAPPRFRQVGKWMTAGSIGLPGSLINNNNYFIWLFSRWTKARARWKKSTLLFISLCK